MPEKLLVKHIDPGSIPDGWHKALIDHVQPYTDQWGDKAAIYFRITDQDYKDALLLWYCPLVATRKNKTGRLLTALLIKIAHGTETNLAGTVGCKIELLTWLTRDTTGHTILITDMRPSQEGA